MYKEIYFAGGCFWGVERYFSLVQGVLQTEVGYANGKTSYPSYEAVCTGITGHAEVVRVLYNSELVSLKFLLELFYDVIDPTSINIQGNDAGTQYRTGIYYVEESDLEVIEESINNLQTKFYKRIMVEVKPLENFYPAEEYHQNYLVKNEGGYCHIGSDKFAKAKNARE